MHHAGGPHGAHLRMGLGGDLKICVGPSYVKRNQRHPIILALSFMAYKVNPFGWDVQLIQ